MTDQPKKKTGKQIGHRKKRKGIREGGGGDAFDVGNAAGGEEGGGEGEYEASLAEEYRLLRARVEGDVMSVLSLSSAQEYTTPLPLDPADKMTTADKTSDKTKTASSSSSSSSNTTKGPSSSSSSSSSSTISKHHATTKVITSRT